MRKSTMHVAGTCRLPERLCLQRRTVLALTTLVAGLLSTPSPVMAQSSHSPSQVSASANQKDDAASTPEHPSRALSVDVLSGTAGVDFGPYLRQVLHSVYESWNRLTPPQALASPSAQGTTLIRLRINPDGTLTALHLDQSARNDAADRTAWASITRTAQFPPLPKAFPGPYLELGINFLTSLPPSRQGQTGGSAPGPWATLPDQAP